MFSFVVPSSIDCVFLTTKSPLCSLLCFPQCDRWRSHFQSEIKMLKWIFSQNICFLTNPLQKSNLSFGMPESWRFFLPLQILRRVKFLTFSDLVFSLLEPWDTSACAAGAGTWGSITLIKIPLWREFPRAYSQRLGADKVTKSILTNRHFDVDLNLNPISWPSRGWSVTSTLSSVRLWLHDHFNGGNKSKKSIFISSQQNRRGVV